MTGTFVNNEYASKDTITASSKCKVCSQTRKSLFHTTISEGIFYWLEHISQPFRERFISRTRHWNNWPNVEALLVDLRRQYMDDFSRLRSLEREVVTFWTRVFLFLIDLLLIDGFVHHNDARPLFWSKNWTLHESYRNSWIRGYRTELRKWSCFAKNMR